MQQVLAVGLGGFIGAIARYTLTGLMQQRFRAFLPAGTLLVNALGCLVIGILMEFVIERESFSETGRLFLITGILGSLTTFSTFGYETVELMRESEMRLAFWNVAANVCIGFSAVWIGRLLVKTAGS